MPGRLAGFAASGVFRLVVTAQVCTATADDARFASVVRVVSYGDQQLAGDVGPHACKIAQRRCVEGEDGVDQCQLLVEVAVTMVSRLSTVAVLVGGSAALPTVVFSPVRPRGPGSSRPYLVRRVSGAVTRIATANFIVTVHTFRF